MDDFLVYQELNLELGMRLLLALSRLKDFCIDMNGL